MPVSDCLPLKPLDFAEGHSHTTSASEDSQSSMPTQVGAQVGVKGSSARSIWSGVLSVGLAIAVSQLPCAAAAETPAEAPPTPIETLELMPVEVPIHFDLQASLEAMNQSTVSAQTHGAIKSVYYDVNDSVSKGALLLEIDNTQQTAQLAQAKAGLAQANALNLEAQRNFQRSTRLHKQGTLSAGNLDQAEAQADSAAANLEAAKAQVMRAETELSYTQVRAPYSGIVRIRHIEVGEWVAPGTPLMTGMAMKPLRAITNIPQRLASQYQSPNQISILLASPEQIQPPSQSNQQIYKAERVNLFPFADPTHHSLQLRARLPASAYEDANLYPGMWATIRFQTGTRQSLLLPLSALVKQSEVTSVFVLRQGAWTMCAVRLGRQYGQHIEVLAGLSAGETIALDGYAALANPSGQRSSDIDQAQGD